MAGSRLSDVWSNPDPVDDGPISSAPEERLVAPSDDGTSDGQSPYREALSRWPDEWREQWGRRANALQDEGLPWRDAEVRAFVEIWNRRRVGPPIRPELANALGAR